MRRSRRWAERWPGLVRAARRLADDSGSASLEFLTVGVLLLVPLVYLVLTLGQIQHAVLGLEGGARHAARTIAQADSHDAGLAAADRALRVAMADAGLAAEQVGVTISCAPDPDACDTPRGTVTVEVGATVPLPFAPPVLQLDVGLGVPISAQAMQPVSAFGRTP
ncbi:Flp pilus assembly protein TadG [Agrococcus baldri]|uniref:Flp pilus assembly protein TadG n=1 Tax=Agrococcus baldri TaxID=153730 RepID=A0AA94HNJ3_9MICO|nr:hypothetical protein [Agrococcus baldri]SFS15732.1 Flp pilus assembly protein TadG [Agrococcus baldri]